MFPAPRMPICMLRSSCLSRAARLEETLRAILAGGRSAMEGNTFVNWRLLDSVAVCWRGRVWRAKGDAEQHLQRWLDTQHLPNGVGVEPEHRLWNPTEPVGGEREKKRLGVHADIAGHAHVVAHAGHEEQSDMRRPEELEVRAGRRAAVSRRFARHADGLVVSSPLCLGPRSVDAAKIVHGEAEVRAHSTRLFVRQQGSAQRLSLGARHDIYL